MKIKSSLTIASLGLLLLAGCNTGNTDIPSSQGVEPVVLTEENFDQIVLASSKPVMVDFWAEW